jgi:WD40 repeat protein
MPTSRRDATKGSSPSWASSSRSTRCASGSVESTLRAFDEARLLSFDRDQTTGQNTVEVAHEALLREWPRLRAWIHDGREDLRIHAILAAQALDWETSERDASYLLTGSRLERYEDWPGDSPISFTALERELVAESIAERDAEHVAEEARRNQELFVERRSVRRLRWLVAAAAVAVLVVGALSVFAVERGRVAEVNEREARARELANAARNNVDADPELAVLLALEATRATRSDGGAVLQEAEEALHLAVNAQRLVTSGQGEWSVAFFPSGDLLVGGETLRAADPATGSTLREYTGAVGSGDEWFGAVSPDGTTLAAAEGPNLAIISADTGELIVRKYLDGPIFDVAFSPDGQTVATLAGYSGGLQVFRIADGALLAQYADRTGWPREFCCPATDLVFSPDGERVAATTWTGEVWLVETATGDRAGTLTGHEGPVSGVAYADDGRTIVTSSFDGWVRFWDVATQQQRSSFDAGVGQVISLAISPNECRMLAGGDGGAVSLLARDGGDWGLFENLRPGHSAFVLDVAFDVSGQLGASVGMDAKVLVWDVNPAHGEVAAWEADRPVAFSGDGESIATTGSDGRTIAVRNTGDWQTAIEITDRVVGPAERNEPWGHVGGIALSRAMDLVATATADDDDSGSVKIWNAVTGEFVHTLLEGAFVKGSLDFSDDGRLVAAAVCNRRGPTAHVWSTTSGEVVFTTPSGYCGQAVDLDPTGRLLVVQSLDEGPASLQVWDVETGLPISAVVHSPAWLGAVQFSPDGSQLLTGGADGTVRVWDVASGSLTRVLTGHTGAVEDASWSSGGSKIVSGSHDGTVRMWDATTGETLLVLEGHDSFPFVELSPDGVHIATATPGEVRIWTLDLDELTAIARTRVPRSLTAAECLTYHFAECPTAP